jgi:DNA-binding protein YbaB
MLDKMKQLWEMKSKMDEIKKQLDSLMLASEDSLVKVSITGSQEIKGVEIKCDLATADKPKLEAALAETINRAVRESQKAAAQKMSALGLG